MMLSIAMFWQSVAQEEADGHYHISGVMGPDEFHETSDECGSGVKDNAYTNVMVVRLFDRVKDVLDSLTDDERYVALQKSGLTPHLLHRMDDIGTKLYVEISDEGVLLPFKGFAPLKELHMDSYRKRYGNVKRIDRILKAEGLSPDQYKMAKQPDALMLYYLLPIRCAYMVPGYPKYHP